MCKNQGKYRSREHESKLNCIMEFSKSSQSKQIGTLFVVCFLLGNSRGITQKKAYNVQNTAKFEIKVLCFSIWTAYWPNLHFWVLLLKKNNKSYTRTGGLCTA
jgi:hypothetical protein